VLSYSSGSSRAKNQEIATRVKAHKEKSEKKEEMKKKKEQK